MSLLFVRRVDIFELLLIVIVAVFIWFLLGNQCHTTICCFQTLGKSSLRYCGDCFEALSGFGLVFLFREKLSAALVWAEYGIELSFIIVLMDWVDKRTFSLLNDLSMAFQRCLTWVDQTFLLVLNLLRLLHIVTCALLVMFSCCHDSGPWLRSDHYLTRCWIVWLLLLVRHHFGWSWIGCLEMNGANIIRWHYRICCKSWRLGRFIYAKSDECWFITAV